MLSIRWGERTAHLTHSVSELYRNSDLTDCVLDVEGELLHVHKIIIAACSPYFKTLLKNDQARTLISIKDVSYKDMKLILDFIYYGEVDVHTTDVHSLTKTAELLEMTFLKHVCHKFQMECTCKDTSARSMEDRCSVSCTNLIKHETNNLMEEQVPHDPAVLHMGEDRLGFKSQSIHVHAIGESSAKYLNNFQDVSGELNEDQSKSSAPNTCDSFMKDTNQDKENLNEELLPLAFVAVSEIKETNERHQDLKCFDSVLKDPLGEYSGILNVTEERSIKKESTFQSEQQVKNEPKDENDVPEPITDVLISDNLTHSFHELTSTKCDPESGMDRNPDVLLSDTFDSEGCASETINDLEVKFESICEISGADVKEKKVFEAGQCLNHLVGDNVETAVLETESELLNSGVQHFSSTNYQQDVDDEDCDATTCEISTPFALEIGKKTPAMDEAPASSSAQTIFGEERKKLKKQTEESDGSSREESRISKKQINFQPLVRRDPVHLPRKQQFRVRNDQVANVQTHSTKVIKHSCSICCKTFSNVCHLRLHMRTHTREKMFHCKISKNSFDSNGHLTGNMRAHSVAKRFGCPICNKTLRNKYYVRIHMRTHSGLKPFKCEVCKRLFSHEQSLNNHMRMHTGNKPFECEKCKKLFSLKNSLNRHMVSHSGVKPFECVICRKSFSRKGCLNIHMRLHSGVKPFECVICRKSFSRKDCLDRHMRLHSGDKPFECDVCKKSFCEKGNLNQHMRTHTGFRSLECKMCKRSFCRKESLDRHTRTHTGDKPFG